MTSKLCSAATIWRLLSSIVPYNDDEIAAQVSTHSALCAKNFAHTFIGSFCPHFLAALASRLYLSCSESFSVVLPFVLLLPPSTPPAEE
eukprot:6209971-Pleurochrysis_carterae.AAC.2